MTDPEPSSGDPPRQRRKDQSWESWIDEAIRDAQERGEFDNLPGAGKPLPDRRNPFLPDDQQLAFNLIQDSGHTLPWIDDGKEIEQRIAAARQRLTRQHEWRRAEQLAANGSPTRLSQLDTLWERDCAAFAAAAAAINRLIDIYNLKVPSVLLHKLRLVVADELARLDNV